MIGIGLASFNLMNWSGDFGASMFGGIVGIGLGGSNGSCAGFFGSPTFVMLGAGF
jgi:hypothetical protein